ncbi:HAD family hydrolase [Vibrio methylphosphonaticus]|uniref:HAD family hydrolase n=1 Tax=Vibrio methylphosphonaticus TaxID=2946866 RepID=UPI002029C97F|nr:HAD family hydrolase [Vibrio methylphosphonaticus]MCL9773853.1 HAD family hydrolase [Vibrio methylphosphonaticus]
MSLHTLKAIVFDLDNTLVSSNINFTLLRQQLNCPQDCDLLMHLEQFGDQEQQRLSNIIRDHEIQDAAASSLMPGAKELIHWLTQQGYFIGVITRNCRSAATTKILAHQLPIESLLTREEFAPKPAPDSLYHLMNKWQLNPQEILYVGDHYYDIETAINANCQSCFISNGLSESNAPSQANFSYPTLLGLLNSLKVC